MKIKLLPTYIMLVVTTLLQSCSTNYDNSNDTVLIVIFIKPANLEGVYVSEILVSFKGHNSVEVIKSKTYNGHLTITLDQDSYEIFVEGKIKYIKDGNTVETFVRGYNKSVIVTAKRAVTSLPLFVKNT